MAKKKINKSNTEALVAAIVQAVLDKKGEELITMDISKINNTICKYFVICHTNSNTHAMAVADNIEDHVRKTLKEKVWHKEGLDNAHWILLDYADVVVHIFQREFRQFYNIEGLWADADIISYRNKN